MKVSETEMEFVVHMIGLLVIFFGVGLAFRR